MFRPFWRSDSLTELTTFWGDLGGLVVINCLDGKFLNDFSILPYGPSPPSQEGNVIRPLAPWHPGRDHV